MSRIERYQESIEKFINNKNTLVQETKQDILNNIEKASEIARIDLNKILKK